MLTEVFVICGTRSIGLTERYKDLNRCELLSFAYWNKFNVLQGSLFLKNTMQQTLYTHTHTHWFLQAFLASFQTGRKQCVLTWLVLNLSVSRKKRDTFVSPALWGKSPPKMSLHLLKYLVTKCGTLWSLAVREYK